MSVRLRLNIVANNFLPRVIPRPYSIAKINGVTGSILGTEFLNSSDEVKKRVLASFAINRYDKEGIASQKKLEKREALYQISLVGQQDQTIIKPSPISTNKTTAYWATTHQPAAPYKRGTARSKHEDKDAGLDILSKHLAKQHALPGEEVLILALQGCDNNDAGNKLLLYLSLEKMKKVHMVATDVSFAALSLTRGLYEFSTYRVGQNLLNAKADMVIHDFFNDETPLFIPEIAQRIALPFRLTAIAPIEKISFAVKSLIHNNDLCVMNFLADEENTRNTLVNHRNLTSKMSRIIDNIEINYYQSVKGHSICVWTEATIRMFIQQSHGQILEIDNIPTTDDHGNDIRVLVALVSRVKTAIKGEI
jgi:hypothetical protein